MEQQPELFTYLTNYMDQMAEGFFTQDKNILISVMEK